MSDENNWQAPAAAPEPAPSPATALAEPALAGPAFGAPTFGAPTFGAPAPTGPAQWAAPPPPPAGWAAPPKPGLIPLRPLDLGTLLGASFRVMRRNPKPTLGASLTIQGASLLIFVITVGLASWSAFSRINSSGSENEALVTAGGYGLIAVSALIPALLVVAASALLQGVIAFEVSRGALGEKPRFRQHWQHAKGRLLALIGWTFLLSAIFGAGVVVFVIVITLAVVIASAGQQIAVGVIFGIVLSLGLVVLFAWLLTKMSLVPSIIMLERASVGKAIARSWVLTKRSFWRVFGTLLLVSFIVGAISQVVTFPISFIAPFVVGIIDPNGATTEGAMPAILVILGGLTMVVSVIASSILSVIQTSAVTLLYLDLRMRVEGLDLELLRYVEGRRGESRQDGENFNPDPYLAHPAVTLQPNHARPLSTQPLTSQPVNTQPAATQPMPPTDTSPWG